MKLRLINAIHKSEEKMFPRIAFDVEHTFVGLILKSINDVLNSRIVVG